MTKTRKNWPEKDVSWDLCAALALRAHNEPMFDEGRYIRETRSALGVTGGWPAVYATVAQAVHDRQQWGYEFSALEIKASGWLYQYLVEREVPDAD